VTDVANCALCGQLSKRTLLLLLLLHRQVLFKWSFYPCAGDVCGIEFLNTEEEARLIAADWISLVAADYQEDVG